jgi:tetratricopeptide (TPR) repeat protein
MSPRLVSTYLLSAILAFMIFGPASRSASSRSESAGEPGVAAILSEARTLFQRGRFERGIQMLEPLTKKSRHEVPEDQAAEVRLLLARGYEAVGRYAAARAALEETLQFIGIPRIGGPAAAARRGCHGRGGGAARPDGGSVDAGTTPAG